MKKAFLVSAVCILFSSNLFATTGSGSNDKWGCDMHTNKKPTCVYGLGGESLAGCQKICGIKSSPLKKGKLKGSVIKDTAN
jgi:hypothetical protein